MASSYRTVLEVLRFVEVKEVLRGAGVLCRVWNKAAESDELWWDLCELYDVQPTSFQGSLKDFFKKNGIDIQVQELPLVRTKSLTRYSIPTLQETTIQLSSPVPVDQFTAYCYLSLHTLLICGGGKERSSCVYSIDVVSGVVIQLANMNEGKRSHAAFKYRNKVYVIGGFNDCNLSTIEKYWIHEDRWEILPAYLNIPMEGFVPARFKQKVYLVGANRIEIFNLCSETTQFFSLSLPQTWFYCLAFITEEGELIIAQKDTMISFSELDYIPVFQAQHIQTAGNGNYWTPGPPVKHEHAIYTFQHTHGTIEGILRMTKDSLTKMSSIAY